MNIAYLAEKILRGIDFDQFYPEFFVYELPDDINHTPNTSTTNNLVIQADGPFLLTEIAIVSTLADGSQFVGTNQTANYVSNQRIQINDSGSGKNLFSAPVPIQSLGGEGGNNRFVLPVPRIIDRSATLSVTIINDDGAIAYTNRVSFIGAKLLNRGTSRVGLVSNPKVSGRTRM